MELNYSGRQMTSRRAFLSAALALASARLAAQDKAAARVYRIGVLDPVSLQANSTNMEQFRKGLKDLGYTEGSNLFIEYLSAEGHSERFARLAGELVRHNVELIVTSGTPATLAAKNASAGKLPVVTAMVVDPVETKLVASLERPGGNLTGVAVDTTDLEAKRLDLLRALAPGRTRIAVIMDMGNPAFAAAWKALQPAAQAQGVALELVDVRKPEDAARAFATAAARNAGAALVRIGTLTQASRRAIVEAAAKHRLPALYASRQFVDAGGLASYGVNTPQMYYRAAVFVDKILKGARPAELPMERPARFELVLNRLAAHRLGLIIPPDLLLKSDQVVG
jgi:putative tryptophan/tyrosine transport system substrate-binding protein